MGSLRPCLHRTDDRPEDAFVSTWSTTGSAPALAAATGAGGFLIDTFTRLPSASNIMLAVTAAFASTLILAPALAARAQR